MIRSYPDVGNLENLMRRCSVAVILGAVLAVAVSMPTLLLAEDAIPGTQPNKEQSAPAAMPEKREADLPAADPAPCLAAIAANDDSRIVLDCTSVIGNQKNTPPDRIKALAARAAVFDRKEQYDAAIADYDALLKLDPGSADAFNNRGEVFRKKGDRPHALADFGAAIKLNPQHPAARNNYKSLALELERLGAQMAVNNKPSFNCAIARRPVEKAICASPELANLDREIFAMNTRVIGEAADPRMRRTLRRGQDDFLATRNASFGRAGYDLQKAMKERLQKLVGIDGY
jgi:tetratricopeptide (TPR) repeat protein